MDVFIQVNYFESFNLPLKLMYVVLLHCTVYGYKFSITCMIILSYVSHMKQFSASIPILLAYFPYEGIRTQAPA